jgi:septal ring factor EnvC (AmiA/AmiB activator)
MNQINGERPVIWPESERLYPEEYKDLVEAVLSSLSKILQTERAAHELELKKHSQESQESREALKELAEEKAALEKKLAESQDRYKSLEAKLEVQEKSLVESLAETKAELNLVRERYFEAKSTAAYYKGLYEGGGGQARTSSPDPKKVEASEKAPKTAK